MSCCKSHSPEECRVTQCGAWNGFGLVDEMRETSRRERNFGCYIWFGNGGGCVCNIQVGALRSVYVDGGVMGYNQ